jgi:nucleoside-diphosphate-sugar epimerase
MPENKLFCFGYGYTSSFFSFALMKQGWSVAGTTRSAEKAEKIWSDGVEAIVWDGGAFDVSALDGVNAVLISTPPNESGCPALKAAGSALAALAANITWLGYLSTNGVYGDHGGAWVDETSALRPTTDRARRRIKAENDWRAFAEAHDLPLIIFRLPGIYGPGRSALDTVRAGKAKRIYKEGQMFSRMHVEDIAAALEASLMNRPALDLYNLADDEPAPPQDVIEYACGLLSVELPPLTPLESADLSEMAKSFYTDNKRVSNQRMKNALAVTLKYATYRDGLKAIFEMEASSR